MTSQIAPRVSASVAVPVLEPTRQVRVWFGQQVVIRYEGTSADAAAYEAAMRRRFATGRVTNEAVTGR